MFYVIDTGSTGSRARHSRGELGCTHIYTMTNRCLRPTVLLLGSERARVSRASMSLPDEHGEIDSGRDTGDSECASSSRWEGAANGCRGWEGEADGSSSRGRVASRACSCASLRRNSASRLAFCDRRSMISFPYSLLSRSQVCHYKPNT